MYLLLIIRSTVSAPVSVKNMKMSMMSLSGGNTKALPPSLLLYRFPTDTCEYFVWRRKLNLEVQDNARFPLLHFLMDDLPTRTRPPVLGDSNTTGLLKWDHGTITSFAAGNNCCASSTTPCHRNRPGFLI